MIPWMGAGSPSMFAREQEAAGQLCEGIKHDERFMQPRRGQDCFAGFCSVDCREDFFSSVGAGDVRNIISFASHDLISWAEILYVRSLSTPA